MKKSISSLRNGLIALTILICNVSCEKEKISDSDYVYLENWATDTIRFTFNATPKRLFFINPASGYLLGSYGTILHTSDSGKTWQSQISGINGDFSSAFFLSQSVGFISTYTGLLKTMDGGNNWTKISYDTLADLVSMQFKDENNGIAIMRVQKQPNTKSKFLVKTFNGGLNWIISETGISESEGNKIVRVDDLYYLIGTGNTILKSDDFSESWEIINTPYETSNNLSDLYFINKNIGFITDNVKAYRTEDGGKNWKPGSENLVHFEGLHFINQHIGFNFKTSLVYDGGDFPSFKGTYMYCTNNGGITFTEGKLYKDLYLGITSFPDPYVWYTIYMVDYNIARLHKFTLKNN